MAVHTNFTRSWRGVKVEYALKFEEGYMVISID